MPEGKKTAETEQERLADFPRDLSRRGYASQRRMDA